MNLSRDLAIPGPPAAAFALTWAGSRVGRRMGCGRRVCAPSSARLALAGRTGCWHRLWGHGGRVAGGCNDGLHALRGLDSTAGRWHRRRCLDGLDARRLGGRGLPGSDGASLAAAYPATAAAATPAAGTRRGLWLGCPWEFRRVRLLLVASPHRGCKRARRKCEHGGLGEVMPLCVYKASQVTCLGMKHWICGGRCMKQGVSWLCNRRGARLPHLVRGTAGKKRPKCLKQRIVHLHAAVLCTKCQPQWPMNNVVCGGGSGGGGSGSTGDSQRRVRAGAYTWRLCNRIGRPECRSR